MSPYRFRYADCKKSTVLNIRDCLFCVKNVCFLYITVTLEFETKKVFFFVSWRGGGEGRRVKGEIEIREWIIKISVAKPGFYISNIFVTFSLSHPNSFLTLLIPVLRLFPYPINTFPLSPSYFPTPSKSESFSFSNILSLFPSTFPPFNIALISNFKTFRFLPFYSHLQLEIYKRGIGRRQ